MAAAWAIRRAWVYPRPRGEATALPFGRSRASGLSPPTRGSPELRDVLGVETGSIPAHAGKPAPARPSAATGRVYPRPRGEAALTGAMEAIRAGLSPPTRGSLSRSADTGCRPRSIPAHAGKPSRRAPASRPTGVYPRPRGEAAPLISGRQRRRGLSPPTRGSPRRSTGTGRSARSIPAHAGKPESRPASGRSLAVYPRPRGEAQLWFNLRNGSPGLSPPTRGSRRQSPYMGTYGRSIPAHAGKPMSTVRGESVRKVYPRPRGEAAPRPRPATPRGGLSPPTRGSQRHARARLHPRGSIPAHAGKPSSPRVRWPPRRVYPRPRGEAKYLTRDLRSEDGLSPPTRGSHLVRDHIPVPTGSIPAHAGKPAPIPSGRHHPRVYPRPRGEA